MILPEPAQIKKPTVGFSARFILKARTWRKILPDNDLQTKTALKK
jgi:hypothetical protein